MGPLKKEVRQQQTSLKPVRWGPSNMIDICEFYTNMFLVVRQIHGQVRGETVLWNSRSTQNSAEISVNKMCDLPVGLCNFQHGPYTI